MGGKVLRSVVKQDDRLLKLARQTFDKNHILRNEANGLMAKLAAGNMNPGINTNHLEGFGRGIYEARGRQGARVYFRTASDGAIEILGYSSKANQDDVIDRLRQLYGK
jgi:putative component of toxin-antitoxin plasmid stabilization module